MAETFSSSCVQYASYPGTKNNNKKVTIFLIITIRIIKIIVEWNQRNFNNLEISGDINETINSKSITNC